MSHTATRDPDRVSLVVALDDPESAASTLLALDAQTISTLEIIAVFETSIPDNLPQLVHPLHVLSAEPSAGHVLAFDKGLTVAIGGWLGFVEQRDQLAPSHLTGLRSLLPSDKDSGIVFSDCLIRRRDNETRLCRGYWRQMLSEGPLVPLAAMLLSRRLFENGVRLDPEMGAAAGWDLLFQCAEMTDFMHVPVCSVTRDDSDYKDPDEDRLVALMATRWGESSRVIASNARESIREVDVLLGDGRFKRASELCQKALSSDPGNPVLLNRLARCFAQQGNGAAALLAMRRACDSDLDSVALALDRIGLEARFGNLKMANTLLTETAHRVATPGERDKILKLAAFVDRQQKK